jgi:hypothetical protein
LPAALTAPKFIPPLNVIAVNSFDLSHRESPLLDVSAAREQFWHAGDAALADRLRKALISPKCLPQPVVGIVAFGLETDRHGYELIDHETTSGRRPERKHRMSVR